MALVVNGSVRSLPQFLGVDVEEGSSLVGVWSNYGEGGYPRFDPDYGVLLDGDGKPYLAVCGTVYDSSVRLYQPVCAARSADDRVIAVAGVYCESAGSCYRAVVAGGNVYRAPVILRLDLENGEYIDVPMGFACGGLCIGAVVVALGSVAGAVVGYVIDSLARKTEAEARKELADVLSKAVGRCGDARCVAAVLSSLQPAVVEAGLGGSVDRQSWVEQAKSILAEIAGIGGLITAVIALVKLRVIVEFLRELFHRGGA